MSYRRTLFRLVIALGNAAVHTEADVADLLRSVARKLDSGAGNGSILDTNGNTVGSYRFVQEEVRS